ncbi:PREDICTED: uncharacterized protein LOC108560205 isoform X2 [Nicrophorus vespilloides]|uniref:Uncharacterized protein LOC108560205 isoform X2 n=1 Tax=Nicrophorus vespilloides TaxID=110193 RepID=A0ABM1MF00_NICVS|nr:PREDICTED: uncharacterized protein LOC108560205 isoform X2 [Nicrophorus vespilloides]
MRNMTGRRSSSIGCRSLIGRRTSVFITSTPDPSKVVVDVNSQVASFRDLLIQIGGHRDGPELREKIRKARRHCVESCKQAALILLPHVKSVYATGIPVDCQNLVLFFFMVQMFWRELEKCLHLVQLIPMDMAEYFETRAGPSNFGNVITQILLCKQLAPDFNVEEVFSVSKDIREIERLLAEMQEFMPEQEQDMERAEALTENAAAPWTDRTGEESVCTMSFFCCVSRQNYI